jgi:hypothetical protein
MVLTAPAVLATVAEGAGGVGEGGGVVVGVGVGGPGVGVGGVEEGVGGLEGGGGGVVGAGADVGEVGGGVVGFVEEAMLVGPVAEGVAVGVEGAAGVTVGRCSSLDRTTGPMGGSDAIPLSRFRSSRV